MQISPYVAFFLSGASSLIFQTIWTRMLHHVFGATSIAISTVLSVFMAGLGLGAWLGGKYANRIKHPIMTYAAIEICIGIWGLLIPLLVQSDGWLAEVNSILRVSFGADSSMFMVARFLCVVPILLVPTTLMGSTLPLLTRHFVHSQHDAQSASAHVGVLYSVNTFGAAAGPLLSAFFLMPGIGLAYTNIVACSLNFTLAALIWLTRRQLLGQSWKPGEKYSIWPSPVPTASASMSHAAHADADSTPNDAQDDAAQDNAAQDNAAEPKTSKTSEEPASSPTDVIGSVPEVARKAAFIAFAASGAAALAYEVVWSRALAMVIGSSIYSFSLILETFLIGIAAGSAAMSAFLSRKMPLIGTAVVSCLMVVLANLPWALSLTGEVNGMTSTHVGDAANYLALTIGFAVPIVISAIWGMSRRRAYGEDDPLGWVPGFLMVLIPVSAALIGLDFPGRLPKIIFSVVTCVSIFMLIAMLLRKSPVLLLALIQLFIAGATVMSYVWQDEIPYAFAQLVSSIAERDLADHVGTVQFFTFITAVLCTLPSTLGMGAMFPLTVRLWTSGGDKVAKDVASVYTANTVGSILGAWLPGFVLFALIGAERTLHVGIGLNMLLALGMLIASATEDEHREWWNWRRFTATFLPLPIALIFALSLSPLAITAEWSVRAGICVFFLGTAFGNHAYLVNYRDGKALPTLRYVMGALPIAVAVLGTPFVTHSESMVTAILRGVLIGGGLIIGWANLREPIPAQASSETGDAETPDSSDKKPEKELPTWHAITVYILAPLIPAMMALFWVKTYSPDAPLRWNLRQMTLGVFRISLARDMLNADSWGMDDMNLLYYRDGLTTTVSVEQWGQHFALKNNGKVDASNGDDMPTQINVAAYPLLLHPEGPEDLDVAVVGFGSGVTVGTALRFPVRHIDVIELERAIPEAARIFQDVNHLNYTLDEWPYVEMDRLAIHNDDGRNFLAASRDEYDVIISEPSNPWITGVSDLFTVDHFRITKQRLRPGGIYCQWVQLYELSPENIKTIYRTFAQEFEHVLVLSADDRSSDTVMLGSDQPITLDLPRIQQLFENPNIAGELERANVFNAHDIFSRTLLINREEILRYTQIEYEQVAGGWEPNNASSNGSACEAPRCRREPVPLNTDDNAHIEFAAPRDLIGFSRYEGYLNRIYSSDWPYGNPGPALANFGEGDVASENYAELALSMMAHGRFSWAGDFIERSQEAGDSRTTAVAATVFILLRSNDNEPTVRIETPSPGPEMDQESAELLMDGFNDVRQAVQERAYRNALVAIEQIPSPLRLHSGPSLRLLYGYLLYKAAGGTYSQYRSSIEQLTELVRHDRDYVDRHPEVYYFLSRANLEDLDYMTAVRWMRTYVEAGLPAEATAGEIAEPPIGEAPTSDVPGETVKDAHLDRN